MNRIGVTLAAWILLSAPAYGGDLRPLMDKAGAAYGRGDSLEAVQTLKQAVLAVWEQVPLTATEIRFVHDRETYAIRPDAAYKSKEPIYLTANLLGYGLRKAGDLYFINIVTDFYLLSDSGKVLGGLQDFGKFDLSSPYPVTDFRLDLTYTVSAPPGEYRIQTVIRDRNSGKNTRFARKIVIR